MLITAMSHCSRPPKPKAEKNVPVRWPFTGAQIAAECGAASEKNLTLDGDTPRSQRVSPSHAAPGEHVPERPRDSVKELRTSVVAAVPPSAAKHMTNRKCPRMVRYRLEAPDGDEQTACKRRAERGCAASATTRTRQTDRQRREADRQKGLTCAKGWRVGESGGLG